MPQGTSTQNIGCTWVEMQILISQEMPNNKNFEAPNQAELKTYYSEFLNYFQSWDVALDLSKLWDLEHEYPYKEVPV